MQFLKEDTLSILNVNSLLVLPSDVNSPPSPEDVSPPVPNPGSNRADRPAALRDIRNPEGEAGLAPALKVFPLIDNLPDEEEPSDGGGTTAHSVNSPDDVDDDDTALLSSNRMVAVHASNQSTSKPDGRSHGAAPHLLSTSDPEVCEHPCSCSPAPPQPPASPPPAAAAAPPQWMPSSQTLLSLLLVHDEAQRQRRFAESVLDCGVCLEPVLGSRCMQFRDCDHVHCEPCLAQYCTGLISEGNVRGVTCPQPRCKATPTPAQVSTTELHKRIFYVYLL